MGSKEWIDMLMEGRHYPTKDGLGMELDKLIMEPALYYRKPEKIRRWQQQIGAGEAGWTQRTRPHHLGEDGMPQIHMIEDNTRSCVWPSRCGFFGYCHESLAIDDPEKFVARKPHHQPETGLVQIGVSGGVHATESVQAISYRTSHEQCDRRIRLAPARECRRKGDSRELPG
jgi:hypothetical protein